ncbi:hypothetical protein HK099_006355 [Clydaea vesicula]|uniref:N-acetyltransferase domain-containing protein n=1 Tax=Clydaea vesicula TaxID=447962 RepID=A0AAD5TYE0_9FUNG|nr:hypothetical protein HK099_006355 [Clydaea vesicula]KAJ3386160.1 hypothetical protein HDU92_002667 [Lobulomyces angularis]
MSEDVLNNLQNTKNQSWNKYNDIITKPSSRVINMQQNSVHNQIICQPITSENVHSLRKINQSVFPVSYNEKFYYDVCETHPRELSSMAYMSGHVVGAICCRKEVLDSENFQYITPKSYPQHRPSQQQYQQLLQNGNSAKDSNLYNLNQNNFLIPPPVGRVYIMTIGVLDQFRRHKVGSILLQQIINQCVDDYTVDKICLHVHVRNEGAIIFYQRHGFRIETLVEGYYRRNKGVEPPNAYLLQLDLRINI